MSCTYTKEYIKTDGITSYALVVGDGYGRKRKHVSKTVKDNCLEMEVKLKEGDVIVAVKNSWVMLKENVEIRMFGVTNISGNTYDVKLIDSFDGKYWDGKIHEMYKPLINKTLKRVGRASMFRLDRAV